MIDFNSIDRTIFMIAIIELNLADEVIFMFQVMMI